jgi:hydroxybutyrate-dimer hydrolase
LQPQPNAYHALCCRALSPADSLRSIGCIDTAKGRLGAMNSDRWLDRTVIRETLHRGADDLLSAGLGAGLRDVSPPAVADPAAPSPAEQRRGAVWNNWRGIADPSAVGGSLPRVPGREFHALLRLPGACAPHRVLLQLPDDFDTEARCLVVSAASGSRGIYGAVAVAGAWALPRGCAVVYTDKACGCDWFDAAEGLGFALDGTVTAERDAMGFAPDLAGAAPLVAIRHAHSQDNPEADWGRHLRQAAEFGLAMLERELPGQPPFRFDTTCVIAVGISNGAAAVLRAAEDPAPWLGGAVAAAPNVHVADGGRALLDYASEAALWLAAASAHPALDDAPVPEPMVDAGDWKRQQSAAIDALQRYGLLASGTNDVAGSAYRRMRAAGWTDAALRGSIPSTALDMWRAATVAYSSAHGRYAADAHPLGYRMAMTDAEGLPRPPTAAERAAWWREGSGIVPGAGVGIIDPAGPGGDAWPGLLALRALCTGSDEAARRVHKGVTETAVSVPRTGLPLLLMHGVDDGLIPEAFSSLPYVRAARRAGCSLGYWRLHGVQHFDAFLTCPPLGDRYRPLLPFVHEALDALWNHLQHGAALPGDREVAMAAGRDRAAALAPDCAAASAVIAADRERAPLR